MSIHVAVEHRTTYRFDRPVRVSPHVVRLRPAPHSRTPVLAYSLQVTPEKHFVNWQQDPFGNWLARLVFDEPTRELSFTVDLVADMTVINPFDFFLADDARTIPFAYDAESAHDLAPYLTREPAGPLLSRWLEQPALHRTGVPTVDFLVDLNRRLRDDVDYRIRMEPGVQSTEETLEKASGSCRDSAWLLVQVLRHLGLASRFVSGYLVQLRADEVPLDGPAGPTTDFTDLHAWAEVFVPGAGWLGLDPTSGLFAGEGHIPLAATPSPSGAAPITGATDVCEVELEFSNHVRRIREDPRVTLPYTDEQWSRIDRVGRDVDAVLRAHDVRLTMGGEPTFVSIDDMASPEWTTAADGPAKRARAGDLARRLADAFAPGGVLQHAQGKWYPGEPLPRWQLALWWRTDGEALWQDRSRLADPAVPRSDGPAGDADASALARALADELALDPAGWIPAFEDPIERLWREARLPWGDPPEADIDPTDPALATPDVRSALIASLDASRGEPAGYVLPLHWSVADAEWATTRWRLRRRWLFLLPGDSPLGLRLPLDALAWEPPPPQPERSLFEPRAPLAPRLTRPGLAPTAGAATESTATESAGTGAMRRRGPVVDPADAPPTALCVEVRDGHLHVFLPPLTRLEHAIDLLAAVERAAVRTGQSVVLEGYPLPRDPRQRHLVIAPDPGVIEVNVHPAASWDELVSITATLYDEARRSRLGTEKFDLDGTHRGTGGGAHLTLGGATPADSPVLRRPDLLRSLLTYWQHHPSLSYLFAGHFVGPTSQAPRVDEGRDENLYELEIAFGELDRLGAATSPWHVDRLFRNLLVDITGNTHRAEFCIDKLFSPEGERGRLGLVELRGFEMPPHPRMALVQALLVRTLVARCWRDPYRGALVRWGTELHDRFLLPFFVAADIADVVDDLQRHGYAFEHSWLAPFLEFRFPKIGEVQVAGVGLELRRAIEPWPVLGEEVAAQGTARYVDSSVERLQVLVEGWTPERHVVTCNGVPLTLRPTGTPGTAVAGVRYRAWQPSSCLHPTIGVHGPLVFDVVDRWSGRSVGGCTYHVTHPGGRSYDHFPVNANEAEARRTARFVPFGHSPGPVALDALHGSGSPDGREYPRTLDLRRAGR